jgi:hypothetical protein
MILSATSYFFIFFNHSDFSEVIVEALLRINDITSVNVKVIQLKYLLNEFSNFPLFGNGISFYLPFYIRSPDAPYIYETQLFSLLTQFGLVISSLVFILYIYLCLLLLEKKHYSLLIFFVLFIFSGLTNPNLTNYNTSLIYSLMLFASSRDTI